MLMHEVFIPVMGKSGEVDRALREGIITCYGSLDAYADELVKSATEDDTSVMNFNGSSSVPKESIDLDGLVGYLKDGYKEDVGIYSLETYEKINRVTDVLLEDDGKLLKLTKHLVINDDKLKHALNDLQAHYDDIGVSYTLKDSYPVIEDSGHPVRCFNMDDVSLEEIRMHTNKNPVAMTRFVDSVSTVSKMTLSVPTNAEMAIVAGNAVHTHPGYGYSMLRRAAPLYITWKSTAKDRYINNLTSTVAHFKKAGLR
jgi:hypothetical protein